MALDVSTLSSMTTRQLQALRENYKQQKVEIPRTGWRHNAIHVTDVRRCDDAIRLITQIIRLRTKGRKPLRSFSS